MPSATTHTPSAGSIPKQSSLVGRIRPLSVTPDARSMRLADRLSPDLLSDGRFQTCRTGVQAANRLIGIGLPGPLVVTVTFDPCKPKGKPARILRALLDVVEGDLHHQFRPDEDDVTVASDFAREQFARLPGKQLVGQSLEGLAEHHESAAFG